MASARNLPEDCQKFVEDSQNGSGASFSYGASAAASCPDANGSAVGSVSAVASLGGANEIISLSATITNTVSKNESGGGFAGAQSSHGTTWYFNVIGGEVAYHLTGSLTNDLPVGTNIELREVGPPPQNLPGNTIAQIEGNGSIDESGILGIGRYLFSIGAGAFASDSGVSRTTQANGRLMIEAVP